MKSLILVAVILQLVLIGIKTDETNFMVVHKMFTQYLWAVAINDDNEYEFGDIIEFPRFWIRNKTTFSHFAIYVGGDPNDGKWRDVGQGDNDIFHRTGKVGKPDCTFGKLAKVRKGSRDRKKNYLDDYIPAEHRSPDKIKERILKKKRDCERYGLINNNCEHLATDMRYGEPLALQTGTRAEFSLKKNDAKLEEIREKYVEVMRLTDENNNSPCSSDAPKQGAWQPILSACLALFCCLLI